jgi:hypothetical protein
VQPENRKMEGFESLYSILYTLCPIPYILYPISCILSVRARTLNRYLSATLKERLRARGAPKLEIRTGHFLEVVIVDFSSAGRHQENFGRTSTKNAQAAKSANTHCNFGAPRALRRSLSVIHSGTDLASRPGLPVPCILYPIPYTLYPIPYTLYLIPYTLYPIPYTLNPKRFSLNPKSRTLNP